jgi:hypothetical protein
VLHTRTLNTSDVDPTRRSRPSALVEIVVTDDRGAPLSDVALDVRVVGAPPRSVATGVAGRALVPDVPRGAVTVSARRIGFKPGQLSVVIDSPRVILPVRLNVARLPVLDTLRIIGVRAGPVRYEEFNQRRERDEASTSITREEIKRRNPTETWWSPPQGAER